MVDRVNVSVSKRVTLIIMVIAQFLSGSMMSAVGVALPTIGREFSMEAVLLGWVATSFILASAAFLVMFGRLADIYGRKRIFLYGSLLFTVSSFLCAISNSAILLVSFRALGGISSAMQLGTALAILTSVFPAEERGRAIGISMAAVYLGICLGPLWGGVLTQQVGWRSIFFLSAFLGLVIAVLVFWKLKGEWAEARGERFDVVGSIAFSLSVILLIYGFSIMPTMLGLVLVLLGVLGLLAFVRWEAKVANPVLNIGLFKKNTAFVFSNLAILLASSTFFAATFLITLYLQYNKGFSPQTAGLILVSQPACMTIFALISGRLSEKAHPRKVAAVGLALVCVALVLFIFLSEATTLGFIVASLAILGTGFGLFSAPNANVIMSSVDRKVFGVASGTLGTMRSSGTMLGMGIVMILFSIYIGKAEITPEYYPAFLTSMKVGFMIFTTLCFGGILAQLASGKSKPK